MDDRGDRVNGSRSEEDDEEGEETLTSSSSEEEDSNSSSSEEEEEKEKKKRKVSRAVIGQNQTQGMKKKIVKEDRAALREIEKRRFQEEDDAQTMAYYKAQERFYRDAYKSAGGLSSETSICTML